MVVNEYLKEVNGRLDFKELNQAFKDANRANCLLIQYSNPYVSPKTLNLPLDTKFSIFHFTFSIHSGVRLHKLLWCIAVFLAECFNEVTG